ncbi:hypothetical protein IFM89_009769 [Coptis chinensis]|uniref:Filament-like plant protein n=1 Tax=Coptis chinensis TaxID=261450 RepID=A0A835I1Q4_9MAGN|nr:hypothetical protein IFM89_009769 [Coptis chinensis]
MDRKSWLWRKKSSEKSPGETDSSGSMSSHSERYSDDQEGSRASPNHNSQSPEVTSKAAAASEEDHDNLKSLKEKLSAALINISAKEDLVKQHAKVAEEAVSDRLGHLDGALKECLRKLRQAKEEQEEKINEAVVRKTTELEFKNLELENQVVELHTQVEAASVHSDLLPKLEAAEKRNSALKLELLARAEELEMMTLERDLSTQTAETVSKQHLESIKKVTKLEAECRKLRAMARKHSSANDHKSVTASSVYVESLTDSQSDSGERLLTVETDNCKMSNLELNGCEPSCSDSWASALIAELDQFKSEKAITRNLTTSSVEIDLMDDFLEMERLAAMPQTESAKHGTEAGATAYRHNDVDCQYKADLEAMIQRTAELEKKLEELEVEKSGLEMTLAESQEQLKTSQTQLREAEEKLVELHEQLDVARESKQATEFEINAVNTERELAESQLAVMDADVQMLRSKVGSLEAEVKEERALSAEITSKCQKLENELSSKRREAELRQVTSNGELKIKQERELSVAAGKLAECQKTIASLGLQLKSLATLEDFMIDSERPLLSEGTLISTSIELWKSPSSKDPVPKRNRDPSKAITVDGREPSPNGKHGESHIHYRRHHHHHHPRHPLHQKLSQWHLKRVAMGLANCSLGAKVQFGWKINERNIALLMIKLF